MDARKVPFEYSYRWIMCSIEISKRYYSLFLGCGLLLFFSVLCVGLIPFIGNIAAGLMTFLYGLGGMRLLRQINTQGSATFDDFLKYTFDQTVFQKFAPFLIIIAGLNMVNLGLTFGNGMVKMAVFPVSTVSNVFTALAVQAAFMMYLKADLNWQDAIKSVLSGAWANIITLIALAIFTSLFAIGSLFMCLVGFLLYFIPMTMPLNYLVFSSIYENLDIEATIKEWSSKSQEVQTVAAPADEP